MDVVYGSVLNAPYKLPDASALRDLADRLQSVMKDLHEKYLEQRRNEYTVDGQSRYYLEKTRSHLLRYLLDMYPKLSTIKTDKSVRFSELVFWILCKCNIMLHHEQIMDDMDMVEQRSTGFEFIVDHELACTDDRILFYDCAQLLAAVRQVARKWNTLPHNTKLIQYVDFLEYRTSMFLCETFDDETHNLVEYRLQSRAGEYAFNHRFIEEMTWYFYAFHRKVSRYESFRDVEHPAPTMPTQERQEQVRMWIERILRYVHSEMIYETFRDRYMNMCLRPAEVELHRRDNPNTTMKLVPVLKRFRSTSQFKSLMERSNTTGQALLDTDEEWGRTLFHIQLVHFYINNTFRVNWESLFVVYDWEFEDRYWLIRKSEQPVLVQMFDGFALAYHQRRWLVPGGFLAAFSQWLGIIHDEFDDHLIQDGHRVDISELFRQLESVKDGGDSDTHSDTDEEDTGYHSGTEYEITF